jgi:diguanylate cyclase (GGDEF)-like protein
VKKRGTILVIDDEAVVFDVIEAFLEDSYDLSYADNGQQGLIMARSEPPDLILLDIGMPDINGYELCWMLKSNPDTESIPVVFVTAFGSAEDEAAGLAAGAVDYISKPINPAVLKARVRTQMELKLQRDYLQMLVYQDALTDLPNRRGFEDTLNREWRRAARYRSPLSLVAIDLDAFRRYNDEYGHLAGDKCLRTVARHLKNVLHRAGDYLVRYEGQKFLALLADTPFTAIGLLAERFRAEVEAMAVPHNAGNDRQIVTVSVGAVTVIPDHRQPPASLLAAAESLLLEIKQAGGNAVRAEDLGGSIEPTHFSGRDKATAISSG